MQPKVHGAWNLHQATLNTQLDWFVLFSSVAAVLGLPGQANYAAGNAFMDSLSSYRHAQNLPALSINWGPWSDVGLAAAAANRGERLAVRGLGSITPDEGIAVLEYLLTQNTVQAITMPFEVNRWVQTYPPAAASSLLRDLVMEAPAPEVQAEAQTDDLRSRILEVDTVPARIALVETHIREQVGAVLGMAARRVDVNKPLQAMGLDSLMTLELRNRLERSMVMKLPATLVFNYPSVAALTRHLADELDVGNGTETTSPTAAVQAPEAAVDEFEDMSQAEIEALLADELASLDDLLGKD
jgi:acyl carrier protein